MTTVRKKLIALVLVCVAPAALGAILQSNASRRQLLEQVERRVDAANRRFEGELEEYQRNSRLALTFADLTPRFQKALAEKDRERAQRFVDRLAEVYKHRLIAAADAEGVVLARGNPERGNLASLAPDTSPAFAELLADKPLAGLISIQLDGKPTYALVSAAPVHLEGPQVGAIAVLTPITSRYLEYLEGKLNADLAISVNGQLLAATSDHPAPRLKAESDETVIEQEGHKLFAVKTFKPNALQRPGLVVEATASRDVTQLHEEKRRGLLLHLAALGAVLLVVLGLALRFAGRLGSTVKGISDAAERVKHGTYVSAPVIHTGDELESLAIHFNDMVRGLEERDRLRETFGRYVTRQVADHLLKGNINLGGELVPVTVLFSDIRSFTSISENMDPRALLDFLNEYFSGMVESVMHHHGVVDKFIGDAIMAVFGAPVPEPNDPLNAIKAALEMRSRLDKINEHFKQRGLPEVRTGIGLHSGQVVAGNMGHSERMEYTVIGDAVNLASRLEGMTKELQCDIVLSEDLYRQVEEHVHAEPLRKIKVKGRDQEVMVYRLIGLRVEGAAQVA
ncbi:MAG TPA: adenylate/guanylate cyclase domain-containing protein [Polyangiales bacterium]|nr:adenylate/guanylate cyclase domain-containing protein [Polyangiales bacterium]